MALKPVDILTNDLEMCMASGSRPILWGPAGVGKTRMVEALARRQERRLVTLIGSLCDPTDVNGFPVVDPSDKTRGADGTTHSVVHLAPPKLFTQLNDGPPWTLFLDELTGTPQAVQSSWLRLMTDGVAGQYKLDMSKGSIIAAANPPDEAVNGQELAGPMVNRLAHFQFPVTESSALEWADSFTSYWGDPDEGWPKALRPDGLKTEHLIKARSFVAGFVHRFPAAWHPAIAGAKFKFEDCTKGWPSPRSLDRAARHLAVVLSRGMPAVACLNLVTAEIGPAAATEFQNYMSTADIPDPEAVLANPENFGFTGRPDVDFVIMQAVTAAVGARPTADRLMAGFKVCERSVMNRDRGAPTKEAAYGSMSKLFEVAKEGSPGYMAITGKMTKTEILSFVDRVRKAVSWFQEPLKLVQGKK